MKRVGLFVIMALVLISMSSLQPVAATRLQATQAATVDSLGGAITFAKANNPTDVNMMLDWTPNTNHIGIYVAQAKGFYKEANLTVSIQQPGDVQVEQIVASNKAQFGISFEEQTTYSRAASVPIVSVAAIIQHDTSGFASIRSKHPLKTPADLNGLKYGAYGSPIEKSVIDSLTACVNASSDKIEYVDIGVDDPLPLMDQGRIDFVWLYYGWEGIQAKQRGQTLDFIMLSDYAKCVPDFYTPILITNETMIKQQPDVVKAYVQATARGYAYAIQHPDESADILLQAAPDLDANLVKESAEWLAAQFQADAPRWGVQDVKVWQRFTDYLVTSGAIKAPIDVNAAFTNDYLPGGN